MMRAPSLRPGFMDSYDEIPYASVPLPDTHPDVLAAIGLLFGMAPAPAERCRVLELGCASGGNLIPMAWHLPGSEFVGVELSAVQVEEGRRLVADLELKNLQLRREDILHLPTDLGSFDYIIAHGVYSWVPRAVQERILHVLQMCLAPAGVGYVSFNTLPGWRVRGMVRDMLLYHTRGCKRPQERLQSAYQMLELAGAAAGAPQDPMAQLLAREVEYLRRASPSYLYHEYLEERNEPLLFREFMARAERHELQYVGDVELHTMFPATLGDAVAAGLGEIDDIIEQEQYMDFLRQRFFRKTLLCHAAVELSRELDLDALRAYGAYADLRPERALNFSSSRPQDFLSPGGDSFRISHPLTKAALGILHEAFPEAVPLVRLEQQAAERLRKAGAGRHAGDLGAYQTELFSLFASQGLRLTTRTDPIFHTVGERPRAHRLARAQASNGQGFAASARHQGLDLDPFAQHLLGLLDGTLTRSELGARMLEAVDGGVLTLPGGPGTDDRRKRALLVERNVERLLTTFARNGLLIDA
jgi:methyltransferase-like protein/SAM-dependent methyltransferase